MDPMRESRLYLAGHTVYIIIEWITRKMRIVLVLEISVYSILRFTSKIFDAQISNDIVWFYSIKFLLYSISNFLHKGLVFILWEVFYPNLC